MRKLITLYIIIAFQSCSPFYYAATQHNTPLLKEKGDLNINAAYVTETDELNGLEFQQAYAITKNIGLLSNQSIYYSQADTFNEKGLLDGKGQLYDMGIGYYKFSKNSITFLNCFFIAGYGKLNEFKSSDTFNNIGAETIHANIKKIALQSTLGLSLHHFDAGVSLKFALLHYSNIKGDLVYDGHNEVDYLFNHRTCGVVEGSPFVRAGTENIKFVLQYTFSKNFDTLFRQKNSMISIGLHANFNILKKN